MRKAVHTERKVTRPGFPAEVPRESFAGGDVRDSGRGNKIAWYYHISRGTDGRLLFVNLRRSVKSQKFDLRCWYAEGNLNPVLRCGTSFV